MIDWFVLLTPLVLLPILLLFVFIGCRLDTAGAIPPSGVVEFSYQPGLGLEFPNKPKVVSFVVTWEGPLAGSLASISRGGESAPAINNDAGEMFLQAGDVGVESEGVITCKCAVTYIADPLAGDETSENFSSAKEKVADVSAPRFELVRDGGISFAVS